MTMFLSPLEIPNSGIPLAAHLRFRAGLHAGARGGTFAHLCPSAWQSAGHAMSFAPCTCGHSFSWPADLCFLVRGLISSLPDRTHSFSAGGRFSSCLRHHTNTTLYAMASGNYQAGNLARSAVDAELLSAGRYCRDLELTPGSIPRRSSPVPAAMQLLAPILSSADSRHRLPSRLEASRKSSSSGPFPGDGLVRCGQRAPVCGAEPVAAKFPRTGEKSVSAAGHHRRHDRRGLRQRPARPISDD